MSGHSFKNNEQHTTQSPLPLGQNPKLLAAVRFHVLGNGSYDLIHSRQALLNWTCFWTLCFVGYMHVCIQRQNVVPSLLVLKLHHSLSHPAPFLLFPFLAELGWNPWHHFCYINALLLSHTLSSTQHFIFLYFYKNLLLLFVIMLKKRRGMCLHVDMYTCM